MIYYFQEIKRQKKEKEKEALVTSALHNSNDDLNDNEDINDSEDLNDGYVIESIDAILEIAKKVYDEELARFNQIETKTNIGLAFAGVLLGVVITFYADNTIPNEAAAQLIYTWVIRLISLMLICVGGYFLFDLTKKICDEELARFEQIEIITIIELALAGVLLGVVITFFSVFNTTLNEEDHLIYTWGIRSISLMLICIGIFFLFISIKSSEYNQFPLKNYINYDHLKQKEYFLKVELAGSYNRVVEDNQQILTSKIHKYDHGIRYVLYGFLAFVLTFILEVVIKNV